MEKKTVLFGSMLVLLAGAVFLMLWRSRIMGPGARFTAGGLVAVSPEGTPLPVPASRSAGNLPENSAIQESGDLVVTLALNPYPPGMTKPTSFELTLADTNGKAIPDAAVSLDLTMPGMYMPPNLLILEPDQSGTYHATGRFTMRGPWRMEAIIILDGRQQSVFFDVWL